MRLQNDLTQCKNDLRDEKNICHNLQASLQTANSKLKAKDKETSDLEATLERLSSTSNDHYIRGRKLEEEKITLEGRVRSWNQMSGSCIPLKWRPVAVVRLDLHLPHTTT